MNKHGRQSFLLEIDDSELRSRVEEFVFKNLENGIRHNAYDQEFRELSAVENGDEELLRRSIEELEEELIGTLSKDSLRNQKNLAIVLVTNSSRAAIRGGLSWEIAFSMSDLYIQEIESVSDPSLPVQLARSAEFRFTRMVNEIKEGSAQNEKDITSEHVINCKNYVFSHLHGRITVQEIADVLSVNANYLSTIFRRSEGIRLSSYILHQKLILVKNLLTYSNYTFLEIANYLGFASQSHLGSCFRRETGYTLRAYRMKYQMQEFFMSGQSGERFSDYVN